MDLQIVLNFLACYLSSRGDSHIKNPEGNILADDLGNLTQKGYLSHHHCLAKQSPQKEKFADLFVLSTPKILFSTIRLNGYFDLNAARNNCYITLYYLRSFHSTLNRARSVGQWPK